MKKMQKTNVVRPCINPGLLVSDRKLYQLSFDQPSHFFSKFVFKLCHNIKTLRFSRIKGLCIKSFKPVSRGLCPTTYIKKNQNV